MKVYNTQKEKKRKGEKIMIKKELMERITTLTKLGYIPKRAKRKGKSVEIACYPLSKLIEGLKSGEVEFPEFQRDFVTTKQITIAAGILVQSLSPIVVNIVGNKVRVLDGQQRILSYWQITDPKGFYEWLYGGKDGKEKIIIFDTEKIDNGYKDTIKVNADNWEKLQQLNGCSFNDWPKEIQEEFLEAYIGIQVYEGLSESEERQNYCGHNSGKRSMHANEMAKAAIPEEEWKLLKEYQDNEAFDAINGLKNKLEEKIMTIIDCLMLSNNYTVPSGGSVPKFTDGRKTYIGSLSGCDELKEKLDILVEEYSDFTNKKWANLGKSSPNHRYNKVLNRIAFFCYLQYSEQLEEEGKDKQFIDYLTRMFRNENLRDLRIGGKNIAYELSQGTQAYHKPEDITRDIVIPFVEACAKIKTAPRKMGKAAIAVSVNTSFFGLDLKEEQKKSIKEVLTKSYNVIKDNICY